MPWRPRAGATLASSAHQPSPGPHGMATCGLPVGAGAHTESHIQRTEDGRVWRVFPSASTPGVGRAWSHMLQMACAGAAADRARESNRVLRHRATLWRRATFRRRATTIAMRCVRPESAHPHRHMCRTAVRASRGPRDDSAAIKVLSIPRQDVPSRHQCGETLVILDLMASRANEVLAHSQPPSCKRVAR